MNSTINPKCCQPGACFSGAVQGENHTSESANAPGARKGKCPTSACFVLAITRPYMIPSPAAKKTTLNSSPC